jgi:uncharacterized protein
MAFKFPEFDGQRFSIEDTTVILTVAGSRSYGTHTDKSDYDYKGLLVPPKREILSPFTNFEQVEWKGDGFTGRVSEIAGKAEHDEEGTIYGLPKFIKLASTCNPNIIETLYTDERHLVVLTPEGELLRKNRDLFLSQNASNTFAGYALSQLKRIKTHKKWIDGVPDPVKDPKGHKQYKIWKKNRNPVRAAIEEKHGYDCKHAMHLVRLMRMGREVLTEGRVEVYRSDREELLAIRNGSWSYEHLVEWAENQKAELFAIVDEGRAVVPEKPDYDKIVEIVEEVYSLAWK